MQADTERVRRVSRLVFAGQLTLVLIAIGAAQMSVGSRTRVWLILAATVFNGLLVGAVSMGVVKERPFLWRLLVVVLVLLASLLFWPAWGEYDGVRFR